MKRQWFLFILVVGMFVWSNHAVTEELNIMDCRILTGFYELWKTSFFGTEPKGIETAAWIRLNADLEYEFILWERTPERAKNTWRRGAIPENVLGVAHTHPQKVDPKPSPGDAATAKKLNLPIYTISGKGIWKVDPSGAIRQVAPMQWYYDLDSCNQQAKPK